MESFQQPAFCLGHLIDDFDPNQVPADGEQYLQSVIYERSNCPAVVVKPLKKKKKKNSGKNHNSEESTPNRSFWEKYAEVELVDNTPSCLLPTAEWIKFQSTAFQQLLDRVTLIRQSIENDYEVVDLPEKITEEGWLAHCREKEPLLQHILHVNQRDLEDLLEYQSNWIVDDIDWYMSNACWYPRWVYSALACLRLPCEPSLVSSLRKIAKTCHRLRTQLKVPHGIETATPLNLIICIVSRNFKQLDLLGKTQ